MSAENRKFPPRVWVNPHEYDEEDPGSVPSLDCFPHCPSQGPAMWQSGFEEYLSIDEHESITSALEQRVKELENLFKEIQLECTCPSKNFVELVFNVSEEALKRAKEE